MKELTTEELIRCIDQALAIANTQEGLRCYIGKNFKNISWEGYGERYNDFLKSIAQ